MRPTEGVATPLSPSADLRLTAALEEYRARLEAGERPSRAEFLAAHADLGPELAECLAGLEFVVAAAPNLSSANALSSAARDVEAPGTLGDFRLVREIGRGGMGIVYEAEQISLGRRVALKVLPFASTLDPRHLQRFQNEARAAACLHHAHIVPVHAVGSERGVHYYAMQFIDGQSLEALIRELRGSPQDGTEAESAGAAVTTDEPGRVRAAGGSPTPVPHETLREELTKGRTAPVIADKQHFRRVAELGVQAAEALEHAHQSGVIHRDIKPGNLLLDGQGKLWVADFGLAQIRSDSRLTMTGDMVGTMRYMSPEQALGNRVVVDQRTDVYSLGATLYELLTLTPAFPGSDRQELLRQIGQDEPKRPRKLNAAVPPELEIVALKAMEKKPQDRYGTAQELADDLRRYLTDQPLRAKRPTVLQRARKWSRRHPALVRSVAACVLMALLTLGGALGWMWMRTKEHEAAQQGAADLALRYSEKLEARGNYQQAIEAIRQAEVLAEGLVDDGETVRRLKRRRVDLELALKLEQIRFHALDAADHSGKRDMNRTVEGYRSTFHEAGLPIDVFTVDDAVERIRATTVAVPLCLALDNWAEAHATACKEQPAFRQHLRTVAQHADPDPFRCRIRKVALSGTRKELFALAADPTIAEQPAITLLSLVNLLLSNEGEEDAIVLLRQGRRKYPDEFWIRSDLGYLLLARKNTGDVHEAMREFSAAGALRPEVPHSLNNVGVASFELGKYAEAIQHYADALALAPDWALIHQNLGLVYRRTKAWKEAEAAYRKAIELDPKAFAAHMQLGTMMFETNRFSEAVRSYGEAVALRPKDAATHYNLGLALRKTADREKSLDAVRTASRLDPRHASAFLVEGELLFALGRHSEAISPLEKYLSLKRGDLDALNRLGAACSLSGQEAKAIVAFREVLKKNPKELNSLNNLALLLANAADSSLRDPGEALRLAKRAIDLKDNHHVLWFTLGMAQYRADHCRDAIQSLHRSAKLRPKGASVESLFLLALAHERVGKPKLAAAYYQQAIVIMTDDDRNDAGTMRLRSEAAGRMKVDPG